MENNILIIDDKVRDLENLKSSTEFRNEEVKSLQNIVVEIESNNLTPVFIKDVTDIQASRDIINNLSNVKAIVLDLNLNSTDGVDSSDIATIQTLLKAAHTKFGNFILFIYSTVADQWENVRSDLVSEEPSLEPILSPSNVMVASKGDKNLYQKIHDINTRIASVGATEILLDASILSCKHWIAEWLFIIAIGSILNLFLLLSNIFIWQYFVGIEVALVLILSKCINLEYKKITFFNETKSKYGFK